MIEDYVIVNLTIYIMDETNKVHYAQFEFLDGKPTFSKVKQFVTNFAQNQEGYLIDYEYDFRDMTENDLMEDKNITKH